MYTGDGPNGPRHDWLFLAVVLGTAAVALGAFILAFSHIFLAWP
jgi:hypothetical protein